MHEEGRIRFEINKYLSIPILFLATLQNLSFKFMDLTIYLNLIFTENIKFNILIRHMQSNVVFHDIARGIDAQWMCGKLIPWKEL